MTPNGPQGEPPDDAEDEPIALLRQFGLEPSGRFVERVRGRIERRELTGNLLWLSWTLPAAVVLEFLEMLFSLVGHDGDRGGTP